MKLDLEHFDLPEEQFLPAPGQGIIAIVGKKNSEPSRIIRCVNDRDTYKNLVNERYIAEKLNLGCSMPVGILSSGGTIKTRFYSLKSDEYKDLNFTESDLDIAVGQIREAIAGYGYF